MEVLRSVSTKVYIETALILKGIGILRLRVRKQTERKSHKREFGGGREEQTAQISNKERQH